MNKITLKNSIQKRMADIELDNEQLENLLQLQEISIGNQTQSMSNNYFQLSFTKFVGVAASLIVIITVALVFSSQQHTINEKIAYEVSKNHLKLKPLEVKSNRLSEISNYFTQLDFKLVNTKILNDPNWQLLGARYCTIQGNTAAQFRLKNKQTGNVETLYQAPYYATQFNAVPIIENGQSPIEEWAKGMGIKIWVEKGVLFALTDNNLQN